MTPYLTDGLHAHIIFCPKCHSNNQHYTQQLYYKNGAGHTVEAQFVRHVCAMCNKVSYDYYEKDKSSIDYNFYRIIPQGAPVNEPQPNPDLPEPCKDTYAEASHVFEHSPRAAAALLRLCLQQLLEHLGYSGTINSMIKETVAKGVPAHIQQFMDYARHHGNTAAHGNDLTIDPEERRDNAEFMFTVVNTVAEYLITRPRQAQENYDKLPESIRQQIAKRDTPSK